MAELERRRQGARQQWQKIFQQRNVSFQIRRQLEQHRSQFARASQGFNRGQKARNEILRSLQPFDMRYYLMRFGAEAKMLRSFLDPVLNSGLLDQLAKGKIHFDGIKLRRVEAKKFLLREFLGIKIRLPGWIRPSGSSHKKLCHEDSRVRI